MVSKVQRNQIRPGIYSIYSEDCLPYWGAHLGSFGLVRWIKSDRGRLWTSVKKLSAVIEANRDIFCQNRKTYHGAARTKMPREIN